VLYPRWKQFNRVFEKLIRRRNSDTLGGAEKRVIKNVINYACGYFGLNQSKDKMRHPKMRLGTKVRSTIDLSKTLIFNVESFCDEDYIIFHSTSDSSSSHRPRCCTPLPLYLCVIELGKLRLLQIFDWLGSSLAQSGTTTFRHLYTNVDNLILAFGSSSPGAHPPLDLQAGPFGAAGPDGGKPEPGGLKVEWQLGPRTGWKFASCALQNWAVITEDSDGNGDGGGQENRTKTNLFTGVSAQRSYEYACQILDKEPVRLEQQRRVNKMLGTEQRTVTFNFVPK
jgi:hypothetical protein